MMKKATIILILVVSLLFAVTGYASTSDVEDELLYSQTLKQIYGNDFEAPFLASTQGESVEPSTGSLHIRQTDLTLPGRNGLDVNIMRRFNSQRTNKSITNYSSEGMYHKPNRIKYKYTYYDSHTHSTKWCYVAFNTEADMIANAYNSFYAKPLYDQQGHNNWSWDYWGFYDFYPYSSLVDNSSPDKILLTRDKTAPMEISRYSGTSKIDCYKTKTNDSIGYNWDVIIPNLKTELTYDVEYGTAVGVHNVGEFQTDSGEVYSYRYMYLVLEIADPNTGSHTDFNGGYVKGTNNYTFGAVNSTLAPYNDTSLGITYVFYITDINGKTYYFDGNGKIQGITDKYNNLIKYVWDGDTSLEIIDTYGKTITVDLTAEDAFVTLTDGSKEREIKYHCSATSAVQYPVDTEKTYIFDVENKTYENNVLVDEYTTEYKMSKKEILPEDSSYVYEARMYSYNIDEVLYPTGYKTVYTYEPDEKYYYCPSSNALRVTGTKYDVKTKKEYDTNLCSQIEYTYNKYTSGNNAVVLDGMGADYRISKYGTRVNGVKVGDYIKYNTVIQQKDSGGNVVLTDTITYDVWDRKESLLRTGSSYKYEEEYEYDDSLNLTEELQPVSKVTQKQYQGTTAYPLETTYTYDDHLNVLSKTVGEMSTTYTYSTDYNILLSEKYHRDANNEVEIVNELTADNKAVAKQYYKENNTVKNNGVFYTYNNYGEVIGVKTYTNNTDFINKTIDYNYNSTSNELTITTTTEDVTNADGVETDVEEFQVIDFFGNTISKTDPKNNTTTFEYDGFGRMTKQTNPDNTFSTVSYDIANNIITATNENNQTMRYTYNKRGLLVESALKDGNNWIVLETNQYDSLGRKSKYVQNRETNKAYNVSYTYDAIGRTLTETVKDENTDVQQASYTHSYTVNQDSNNRPTTTVTTSITQDNYITPSDIIERYDYRNLPVYKKDVSGVEMLFEYDYIGNLLKEKDANNANKHTDYTYDYMGNVLTVKNAKNAIASSAYDQAGRKISQTDFNQKTTTYTYDELGRNIITASPFSNNVTSTTKQYYDNNGNVIKTMQQSNAVGSATTWDTTEYSYDSRNRLLWTKTMPETNTNNYVQYKYDNVGNVLKVFTGLSTLIDVNGSTIPEDCAVTSYQYDMLNRVTSITDPYQESETFTYDYAGNVLTKTDRNGTVSATIYNAFNQPLSVTSVNGTETLTSTYTYDTMGNIRSAVQNGQSIIYNYNNNSQLTSEQYGDTRIEYTYYANTNNVSGMTAYNGNNEIQSISYTYDNLNQLITVNGEESTTYSYDNNGRLLDEETGNNKSIEYTYNDMGLLTQVTNGFDEDDVSQYNYTYYLNGNRKTENTKNYVYDGMGRIKGVTEGNNITGYSYDKRGNISLKTSQGAENYSETYQYDLNNRLLESVKIEGQTRNENLYYYDENGNMVYMINNTIAPSNQNADAGINTESDRLRINTYDLNNRLISTQIGEDVTSYTYDATGMRREKNVGGDITKFVIDRGNVIAELGNNNALKASYERGLSLICSLDSAGNVDLYYYHNGHGDITQLLDTSGTLVQNYDFDAYGNEVNPDSTDTNPFRYCDEYYDAETGLIYLRNRYYDPSIGSFITEDPIRDGLNWYAYCGGNPVNRIDPWGLSFQLKKELYGAFKEITSIIYGSNDFQFEEETDGVMVTITGISCSADKSGSAVGRALFEILSTCDTVFKLTFDEKNVGGDFNDKNNKITVGLLGDLEEKEIVSIEEQASRFIHECVHAYTAFRGYDSNLYRSGSGEFVRSIVRGYKEATAITVENVFRNDVGAEPRDVKKYGGIGFTSQDYGFWPWVVCSPIGDMYGKVEFHNGYGTLRQGPYIWYDIIQYNEFLKGKEE